MIKYKDNWYCYLLSCSDGSYYCGISNDLANRVNKHNIGKASKYTRGRLPVRLIWHEYCGTKSKALKRECQVKKYSRKKKEMIVFYDNNCPYPWGNYYDGQ